MSTSSPLSPSAATGLARLRQRLAPLERALVAFSGGVDSSVLLAVAHQTLGTGTVAFTAVSPSFPEHERELARQQARRLGVRHEEHPTGELELEAYRENRGDRCYHCKKALFRTALARAAELGIRHVLEGTVTDELQEHRPGLGAIRELGIRQPLVEAGLAKAEVREIARHLGVPAWDRPSFACLASRFPVGIPIDAERLSRVERVEAALREAGFRQYRARFHEVASGDPGNPGDRGEGSGRVRIELVRLELVRIEVGADELHRFADDEIRRGVAAACLREGFRWITVDLLGYRTGNVSPAR